MAREMGMDMIVGYTAGSGFFWSLLSKASALRGI